MPLKESQTILISTFSTLVAHKGIYYKLTSVCLEPIQSISMSKSHATNMVPVPTMTSTSTKKIKPFTNIRWPVSHTCHAPDSFSNASRGNTFLFFYPSCFSTEDEHELHVIWRKRVERDASMIHFSSIGVKENSPKSLCSLGPAQEGQASGLGSHSMIPASKLFWYIQYKI